MTHREIAKIANVSSSTVSKALSGSKEVSSEVAEEIKRIAFETGYFKEKSKRKLEYLKEKAPLIAVVCPEILGTYYSETVTIIKREIEARGGHMSIYIHDFNHDKMNNIIQMLIMRNDADGIITLNSYKSDIEPTIPVVCLSNDLQNPYCDTLGHNSNAIFSDAVSYLKDLGHSRIGFIGEKYTMGKYYAFKDSLKKHGLEHNNDYIHIIDKRFEEIGYEAAQRVLSSRNMPTAFITAYDEIALSFIHELIEHGIKIPDDLSVMGINDIPYSAYAQIPLTTINMYLNEMVRICVDILFERIFDNSHTTKHLTLSHSLVIRESTSPPKNRQNHELTLGVNYDKISPLLENHTQEG